MVSYPAVAKELAVAAVAVLPLLLIGGGGGGRAVFRAAVLVGALVPVVGLVLVRPVALAPVALAVRVTEDKRKSTLVVAWQYPELKSNGLNVCLVSSRPCDVRLNI